MGSLPSVPEFFSREKIVDVAEFNQQHCCKWKVDSGLKILIEPCTSEALFWCVKSVFGTLDQGSYTTENQTSRLESYSLPHSRVIILWSTHLSKFIGIRNGHHLNLQAQSDTRHVSRRTLVPKKSLHLEW